MDYRIVSEVVGLVWTGTDRARAKELAAMVAVNTGHTTYLQEGTDR